MCKKKVLRSQSVTQLNVKFQQIQCTAKKKTVVTSTLNTTKKYDLDRVLFDISAGTLSPLSKSYATLPFESFAKYFWGFEYSTTELRAYTSQTNLNLDLVLLHSKQKVLTKPLIIENTSQQTAILDGVHRILGFVVAGAQSFSGDMLTEKQLQPYEI
ncbi:hypothetical protein WKW71_22755 [Vibrio alginolyticus]|uniref:hypothetical protein n=1 Tax=Vibrio TaxID=662 RepID=UPI002160B1CD|nr:MULTISPECIES: hypothetical protein [Vibrio]MCS0150598.1 hypothetical protein [Vibrio alginolyticus]MDW1592463.1 hypothetical protein [Vibrio sp. Vb2944]MDW1609969.1 hypothetical protein [Vibrio sp. Vb2908]MDW1725870.1 hypothetical protein [Vibrio sp. Vb2909]